ncbi:hypothetical protein ACEPAI_9005 [Sanghuangporus weigelae]
MKFVDTICLAALVASVAAAPLGTVKRQDGSFDGLSFEQIDALTPPFGHDANVNPTGTGDCDGAVNGANGQPIKVPCACPPDRTTFINSLIGNLNAGHVVNNPSVGISFPSDNSVPSIQARFNAASVTLQNLNGAGKGCPQVSTTWTAQLNAIVSGASTSSAPVATSPAAPAAPSTTEAPAPAPSSTDAPVPTSTASSGAGFDGLSFQQIDALTPPFGHDANVNPTGTGDCDGAVNGANGQPIKVPCACPPDRTTFINSLIGNLNAGHVVNNPSVGISFPTDDSTPSIQARFNAASVTLQNLNGAGKGCPQASTTWTAQLNAILSGASTSVAPAASAPTNVGIAAPASSTAAAAAPAATGANGLSVAQIDALAPDLGFTAGVNPTGTGDCDGAVNGADGKPIKVPCSCPPARDVFIQSLAQDIAAGHAVNNPSVAVSFPTDDSKQSQITRIQSSLVALQNLNGAGKGCPAASTTLSAQLKALTG